MVHAYVSCDTEPWPVRWRTPALNGPGPHRIEVIIAAKDNRAALMAHVKQMAPAPRTGRRWTVPLVGRIASAPEQLPPVMTLVTVRTSTALK